MASATSSQTDVNVGESKQLIEDIDQEAWRVGWLFVQQYYTFLNKDPAKLHCFYNKKSHFTFGNEGEEIKAKHGQQEINQRIQELDFQDCQVKLSNIDSQMSNGGVLVHVLGEMLNRGGPSHKFAQTFFLAEQKNGYYVLNDIFRYLKEEVEAEYDDGNGGAYEGGSTAQEVDTHTGHQQHHSHAHAHHQQQQLHHQLPPSVPVQHERLEQNNHYADYNTASRVSPLPVPSTVTLQRAPSPSRIVPPSHNGTDVANLIGAVGGMNAMMQTWSQPPTEHVEPASWGPVGSASLKNDSNNVSSIRSHSKSPSPPQPIASPVAPASNAPVSYVVPPIASLRQPSPTPQPKAPSPSPPSVHAPTQPATQTSATPARQSALPSPLTSPTQKVLKPHSSRNNEQTVGLVASASLAAATAEKSIAVPSQLQAPAPAQPTPKAEPPKPKTWATIANTPTLVGATSPTSKGAGASVNGTRPASPTLPASNQQKLPSRPQSRAENERRASVGVQENGTPASANAGKKFEQKTVVDERNSIYVKNVIHAVTRDMVRELFSKFGTIRHIDVVPTKGIAFVEFTSPEPVQKAVAQNIFPIALPDGSHHNIIAERRKIFNPQGRGNGPRYANESGFDNQQRYQHQQQRAGNANVNSNNTKQQQNRGPGNKQQAKSTKA